jgi:hypothetical protein
MMDPSYGMMEPPYGMMEPPYGMMEPPYGMMEPPYGMKIKKLSRELKVKQLIQVLPGFYNNNARSWLRQSWPP